MITKYSIYIKENVDLDPYGEEIWNQVKIEDDPSTWESGDRIICVNKDYGGGDRRLEIGEEYIIFEMTDEKDYVSLVDDMVFYPTRFFKLKK